MSGSEGAVDRRAAPRVADGCVGALQKLLLEFVRVPRNPKLAVVGDDSLAVVDHSCERR
jgi:hypothetical protein